MPIFNRLRKLACCVAQDREEQEVNIEMAPLILPKPEPDSPEPAAPGRPHQDFVENEARKYWQDMVNPGSLVKPGQDEIRAAAMPILCAALRRRTGWSPWNRAHQGVNAMQLRYLDKGWIKHPYTPSEACPDYVEALVQLADDADLIAREIPLPAHPGPQHPPIYYETHPVTGQPVPRRDANIRGDYVYFMTGRRFTRDNYIYPWQGLPRWPMFDDFDSRRVTAYYTLFRPFRGILSIMLHWKIESSNAYLFRNTLDSFHFSPYPPVRHLPSYQRTQDTTP